MSSARENNREAFINPYELEKIARCARNQKKFDELNLAQLAKGIQRPIEPRKRIKKAQGTSEVPVNNHNLRPRPERNPEIATAEEEIPDCETTGDFLCDNEVADMHSTTKRKRNGGRKLSRMDDILLKEPGSMPKIKIDLNKIGQPIGDNYRKLSSVIRIQTRKMLPVGCSDWRLVDVKKKMALWDDIKKRFDIDDAAMDWVLSSAGQRWKQFKATLKRQIFNETLTDEEMKNLHGHRIDDHELDSLLKYWRSPESQALAVRGKSHRAKVKEVHTAGSVSFASAAHKLGQQLGRPPRRDEVYVKTHTRKSGLPLMTAASIINELKEVIEAYPELKDKTIQQGDAFATVCGLKEPRGRVRCLGLGPTPQDIGTPGLKAFTSTRLQLQVLARQQVESENLVLRQSILEMQEREQQRMALDFPNVETISQHGSNSRQHVSPRSEELGEANHHVEGEEDDGYAENEDYDEEHDDEAYQNIAATAASPALNIIASPRKDVQKSAHDGLAGDEVILFAMSSNEKVAKATVVSVNPNNKLAGETLGTKFCEVIVSHTFKRDALVPRPYAQIKTLGDAVKMPVAWPFNRLKVCSQQPRAQGGGVAARSSHGVTAGAARSSHCAASGATARSSQGGVTAGSSQGAGGSSQSARPY